MQPFPKRKKYYNIKIYNVILLVLESSSYPDLNIKKFFFFFSPGGGGRHFCTGADHNNRGWNFFPRPNLVNPCFLPNPNIGETLFLGVVNPNSALDFLLLIQLCLPNTYKMFGLWQLYEHELRRFKSSFGTILLRKIKN